MADPADLLTVEGFEIGEGERHYTLVSLAGLLHDGERSAEDIAEILRSVRDAYFTDGKGDAEIDSIAAYAVRGEPFVFEREAGEVPRTLQPRASPQCAGRSDARSVRGVALGKS